QHSARPIELYLQSVKQITPHDHLGAEAGEQQDVPRAADRYLRMIQGRFLNGARYAANFNRAPNRQVAFSDVAWKHSDVGTRVHESCEPHPPTRIRYPETQWHHRCRRIEPPTV